MNATQTRELGVLQTGDGAKDGALVAVFELGLKADHVVERAECIILAQLHDGGGFVCWVVGVGETDRFHRTIRKRFRASFGHHFDG